MLKNAIRIDLFGGFTILKDNKPILTGLSNTRKTKLFMAYLLVNRDRNVPHKELFELLWSGEDYSNPGTALRTLLYRLRGMLEKEGDDKLGNAIISKKGTYQWNPKLDASIDVLDFEKYASKGLDTSSDKETRAKYCRLAIDIYKGNLLPDFATEPWMISKDAYYREMYEAVVESYICYLRSKGDLKGAHELALNALSILQNSELIELEEKIAAADLEADVSDNDSLKNRYNRLNELNLSLRESSQEIQSDFEDGVLEIKAYVCDYETFKGIYRFQRRMLSRTKLTLFLGMIHIASDGEFSEAEYNRIIDDKLKQCSFQLRLGDTICKIDNNRFAILFPSDSYDDALGVLVRIKKLIEADCEDHIIAAYSIRVLKNAKE